MLPRVAATGIFLAIVTSMLLVATPVGAHWGSDGPGVGTATTGTLAPPTDVLASSDRPTTATITWSSAVGTTVPEGYLVERIDVDGAQPACGTRPGDLESAITCDDVGVAGGVYTYRVTSVYRTWSAASAASAPVTIASSLLGAAESYSVLGTAVSTTGFTRVSGDLGVSPGTSVVGFPDGIVGGDIHAGDDAATSAQLALVGAYDALAARTPDAQIADDLIGRTFGPGVYHAGAALGLTGVMTLDGGGDPGSVFVFQADAAVNTAAASSMVLTNGAQAQNVYWVANAAVGIGANASFAGSVLARGAITLGAGAQLVGRALSRDAVTMADNVIRFTEDSGPTIVLSGGSTRVTKNTAPVIDGTTTALPGRTVTITIAGQMLTTQVQPDSSWAVTWSALQAGSYSVVAKVRDAAGNGAAAAQTLVVEASPPAVALGVAAPFSILAGTTVVATGDSSASGDVGVSPGSSITGMPPTAVGGTIHAGDQTAADALTALGSAIADAAGRAAHTQFAGDQIGTTFHAGVHHTSAAYALSGTSILDAEGDAEAVFIFQIDAAMDTAASASVLLVNGADAANVFWVVEGAVTTGALSTLPGTILATSTITLGEGTQLTGRALTLGGVVMAGSTITQPMVG